MKGRTLLCLIAQFCLLINCTRAGGSIKQLHINTIIQLRYAITNVQAKIENPLNSKSDVTFELYIPKEAFVSNFTMVIKDKIYEAKVKPTQEARDIFANSQDSSALVETQLDDTKFKDGRQVKFTAKLDPLEKATFYLSYEELLERREKGRYAYEFNVQPKQQFIEDFNINVLIAETKPLKDISVQKRDNIDQRNSQLQDLTNEMLQFDEKRSPYNAVISLQNAVLDVNNGQEWKLIVRYDVERSLNEVQVGPDGKFIHYFNPDQLARLRKHVIFVIDISGSMSGRKLQQTQHALTNIFSEMGWQRLDYVDILTFNSEVHTWQHSKAKSTLDVQEDGINTLFEFVYQLEASGSTNISGALLEALEKAKSVRNSNDIDAKTQQAIIFLTDGQPNVGITSTDGILDKIKEANQESEVPIYSLSFGNGPDFEFLTQLSYQNHGFAHKIYDSGNSFEQLENFYMHISDPKLKNVELSYVQAGDYLPEEMVTEITNDTIFGSNEYIMIGTLDSNETIDNFQILLNGTNGESTVLEHFTPEICSPWVASSYSNCALFDTQNLDVSSYEKSFERLWAYKRILYLLKEGSSCHKGFDHHVQLDHTNTNQCKEEAEKLALQYNFVTEVTSMVVEETDEYVTSGSIEALQKFKSAFKSISNKPPPTGAVNWPSSSTSSGTFTPNSHTPDSSLAPQRPNPFQCPDIDTNKRTRNPRRQSRRCAMVLFTEADLFGECKKLTDPIHPGLNFYNNEVGSIEVFGGDECCWILYQEENFLGHAERFTVGKYEISNQHPVTFKSAKRCDQVQD